ncbi:MAG TPA: SMC-Scp complex subunit ScpB [Ktedonobacterales bacterium]|jgi:segregation and condensation protein B
MKPEQKQSDPGEALHSQGELSGEQRPGSAGDAPSSKQEIISPKEMRRWGEAIRQRRRDLDLTLKQLAEVTGVSFGYLAKLERGDPDAKNPTRLVIDALRAALNVSAPGGVQLSRTALASWRSGLTQQAITATHDHREGEAASIPETHTAQQRWQVAEALLLICGRLSAAQLAAGLDCALFEVEETIQALRGHLMGHGVVIQEMNGEYQLASDAAFAPALRLALTAIGLAPRRQTQLTQAQREVLALVIMHQPITRAAIERYRGVDSEKPLHALIEAELVTFLSTTTPHGARQYISTLRVLEESGYSSLDALHQAIGKDMSLPMIQSGGQESETTQSG